MSIKLVDSLQSMGDFPVAFANSIECADGTDLETKLSTLNGGGGTNIQTLTEEEYQNLTDQEKLEGDFHCYDTGNLYYKGVSYGRQTDISTKQDNLNQVKFTIRRNSVNEPRYCMIASSDLSQNLLMCEPYRFKGIFGSSTESVEKKSLIDLYVSFREGAVADKVMKGYADSSEAFDYVDLIITVDETENRSYAYVDFLTSGSMCSGEITVPVLDAEKYMTFADSFELVSEMQGTELCRMSDYAKIITNIDDTTASTDTVWSSQKTSDEIAKVDDKVIETIANPTELDTNKYIKNGFYSIGDATKRTNLPMQNVGTLLVYYAGHYVIQEYILNANLRRFMRRSTDKGANWSAWQELATMDKVALKQEHFIKTITLTDSNWKYETITFEKNYKNTPSINVSCGDYLNTKFYSYWGCEAYIINLHTKGCTIRYRSSKASESEPLEVNIIVFVNGI